MTLVSHLPPAGIHPTVAAVSGAGPRHTGDLVLEQEPARPFAYVALPYRPAGVAALNLSDPAHPTRRHAWTAGEADARAGDVKYFKHDGRYYLILALQDAPDGAVVFDVTDLPDRMQEVGRIRVKEDLHHLFAYKHSDGRVLLLATGGEDLYVFDMAHFLDGAADQGLLHRMMPPEQLVVGERGFQDVTAAYHPASGQDRLYTAGAGGYFVYDVTDPAAPALLTQVNAAAVRRGTAIGPTPDGRYVVTAAGYLTSPLRIYDLQPALDGSLERVRTAVSAWTANWKNTARRFEVRWPYVFVAALDDGLQVFNMRDPFNPFTVGYYRTWDGPAGTLASPREDGARDVDVRNADGLIVVSDRSTGFWAFTMEAFQGWDGHGWGLPDISSAQDWDHGPDGAR